MNANEYQSSSYHQHLEPLPEFTFKVNEPFFMTPPRLVSIRVHSRFHFLLKDYLPRPNRRSEIRKQIQLRRIRLRKLILHRILRLRPLLLRLGLHRMKLKMR